MNDFFIISDGQPVPGTGLPMTVYNLFHGSEDIPAMVVDGTSAVQPRGPLLEAGAHQWHRVDLHADERSGFWRLAKSTGLNLAMAHPKPASIAARVRDLGLKKAIVFGPGSHLIFWTQELLGLLPEVEATIYIVDDIRAPSKQSRNPIFRGKSRKAIPALLNRCAHRFVITDEMAERYQHDFGLDFQVLPLPVPDQTDAADHSLHGDWNADFGILDVFLAGTLGPLYDESLRCLAQAFQHIVRSGAGTPRLTVCGRAMRSEFLALGFEEDHLAHMGWLPDTSHVLRRARRAMCTFVPYVFAESQRDFYELSFPGKTAYYLAAGAPILVHGPAASAVARYFRRHDLDFVCDSLDPNALAEALLGMARIGPETREDLRARYCEVFDRNHRASVARARLLGHVPVAA